MDVKKDPSSHVSTILERTSLIDKLIQGCTTVEDVHKNLISREGLLDALTNLYDECGHENLSKNKHVAAFVKKYTPTIKKLRQLRIKLSDFEVKDVIGRGHFGEVQVVRDKNTDTVYAMKTLHKHETLSQQEISFYEEERDIMATATSPWITRLHFAFQDSQNLYLVMEFHAGGDLLSLLSRYDDIFEEKMAQFYLAEMTLAIHALHDMNYVHRDVKPENILIDCHGHVKLADFGSSAKLSRDSLVSSRMPVGTPDYVSPELLTSMNNHRINSTYGVEVDWWSLGVCMYEMLFGKTPFTDDSGSMVVTYSNIMNFKKCLKFPKDHGLSTSAIELIQGLLEDKKSRFGYTDVRQHRFFSRIRWDNIRNVTPPFVPQLVSLDDTSNFEEFERIRYQPNFDDIGGNKDFTGKDLPFLGFTFVRQEVEQKRMVASFSTDTESDISSSDTIYHTPSAPPKSPVHTNLEVTLTVKVKELQNMQEKCQSLEEAECRLKSQLDKEKNKNREKDEQIKQLKLEKESLEQDMENYASKTEAANQKLKIMMEEKAELEWKAEELLTEVSDMNKEAQQIQEDIHRAQLEELQEVITQIETEKAKLLKKLSTRDKQLDSFKDQLAAAQENALKLQKRLDKERRKSRDDQRRDLVVLETREETWRTQMEDKNTEIFELNKKVQELEELIEAYDLQEKEYMDREQTLLSKVQGCGHIDKVELRVWLKSCPLQESKDLEGKLKRIKDLEEQLANYEKEAEEWLDKEEEMRSAIDQLHNEMDEYRMKAEVKSQTMENLQKQVQMYQEELAELKIRHNDLQKTVKTSINDQEDKNKTTVSLQKKIKDLEADVELLREERRKQLKDLIMHQKEIEEKTFKIAEYERTISRQTSRLERLERQLSDSRDREVEQRIKAMEHKDLRLKIAEERATSIQEEKDKLEKKLSDLSLELAKVELERNKISLKDLELDSVKDQLEKKITLITSLQNQVDANKEEKFDLSEKMRNLTDKNEQLSQDLKYSKEEIDRLNKKMEKSNKQAAELIIVKNDKERLETQVKTLEIETKKLEELDKLKKDKDSNDIKIQNLEKELEEQKILAAKRWNKIVDAEDLRQENNLLQSKIKDQQEKMEALEVKVTQLQNELKTAKESDKKINLLHEQIDKLRLEKKSLEFKMRELQVEYDQKQHTSTVTKRDAEQMEEKLAKEKEKHDRAIQELRRELHDANLALSEARSLLASVERQERTLRSRYQDEVKDLQVKLHKSENVQDVEQELRDVKAQNEKFNKQLKEIEEKLSSVQREKSALSMEKQLLKDQLSQKEHLCEIQSQKVEKLQAVCKELESQITEFETLAAENEKQQDEWNRMRETYEKALIEREEENEGSSYRLHALEEAKNAASGKISDMKQQIQLMKGKHKTEVENLNQKLWDAKRQAQKHEEQLTDLREQLEKLRSTTDAHRKSLQLDMDDKRNLKEEMSAITTENQELRAKNLKLKHNLDEAMDKFEMIFGEKVDLENFAEALQGLHFLEKYKFESTIGQQMKLIDYLQALWQENNGKKKKSSSKLFGGKGKENINPSQCLSQQFGDLQSLLDLERKRNAKLQEQVERLRQENFQQANELLSLKGPLVDRVDTAMTPQVQRDVEALARSPSVKSAPVNLLTPSVKRSSSIYSASSMPETTPKRIKHNIPHRFVTGLNTRATKCCVCLGSVPFACLASKCQECHFVCHPKCVTSTQPNCGMPTEYIECFNNILDKVRQRPLGNYSSKSVNTDVKMRGWLKIPRTGKEYGKQAWERKWASLEDNILMLYNSDTDANPIDTFDLNPPETDVTVHSAVSKAELPNATATDLLHVMKLEHQPLTTCWPGRILYLMAMNFSEKQKWIACLEGAVKNLMRSDKVVRQKLQTTTILDLPDEKRLDINCATVFSKGMLLMGADEGLFMVNLQSGLQGSLTTLRGFQSVHQIEVINSLGIVIMVIGRERHVVVVDKKLIKFKMEEAVRDKTPPIHYDSVENLYHCTLLEVKRSQETVYLVVGMPDKILILKFNPELRSFCVRKEIPTPEPCSCMCIAQDFVIVGTDKFYKIDLEHHIMTEFVDKKDNSLAFAAYGAVVHQSFPLGVVKVSPEGLPLEFLLCFHDFGVFVDVKGRRTRSDLKWSCLPLSFAYSEPFLYVVYFNSIQGITVPVDKSETRGKQTILDLQCPRYIGKAITMGGIYVSVSNAQGSQLLCLKGKDGLPPVGYNEDKENKYSMAIKKNRGPHESPRQARKALRRQNSQSSIESFASGMSSTTVSSVGSRSTYSSEV